MDAKSWHACSKIDLRKAWPTNSLYESEYLETQSIQGVLRAEITWAEI